jgi:hypothetical protein
MQIACTTAPGRGDTDLLLQDLAAWARAGGLRVVGTVQVNTERPDAGPCDMDVAVLPDGPVIRISQSLGRGARGCRLDPSALERAVGHVETELAHGADCVIVNKFGKHEAEGRGFRPVIAEALFRGLPVLVGLNVLNRDAFLDFAGNEATELPAGERSLRAWMAQVVTAPVPAMSAGPRHASTRS